MFCYKSLSSAFSFKGLGVELVLPSVPRSNWDLYVPFNSHNAFILKFC